MAADFAQPLSLAQLARMIHRTPLQFLREFSQLPDMTPHAYLVETRVPAARPMMQAGAHSLAGIAHDCGFGHQSHMGAAFRKTLGLTPGQYLARIRHTGKQ
ncbi:MULTISPECIES: helix-turn-helix domain-containing protein [Delftia]|nr:MULTISPECIES: AraC family transcriptional regulator [Delftia]